MTTHPQGERVEITPEALEAITKVAQVTLAKDGDGEWSMVTNGLAGRVFGTASAFEVGRPGGGKRQRGRGLLLTPSEYVGAYIVAAQPAVVLALVERIRELETIMSDAALNAQGGP